MNLARRTSGGLALGLWALLAACGDPGDPAPSGPDHPATNPTADPSASEPVAIEPGTKPIHRLNRAELDNTIRDLFDTELKVAADLPLDESAYGYDNIAEGLALSPVHFELLEVGVDAVLDELFGRKLQETSLAAMEAEGPGPTYSGGQPTPDGYALGADADALFAVLTAEHDGVYRVGAWASGLSSDEDLAELSLAVDGDVVRTWPMASGAWQRVDTEVELDAGNHTLTITLANSGEDELLDVQRRIIVDAVELEGPLDPQRGPTDAFYRLVQCEGLTPETDACAEAVVASVGLRAWRRPLDEGEVTQFHGLYLRATELGLPYDEALQLAVKGLLLSPDFIYRVELDPTGSESRSLNGYELASRLSYFLWSSTPDDALLAAAADGTLLDPEVTAWHVQRMLDDPRSIALVDNFVGQWWDIRDLADSSPDPSLYANWSEELGASMAQEMYLLGEAFILGGRDYRQVLDSDTTRVDALLAAHYGIDAPSEPWAEVSLVGTPRRGLLGMAGWATVQAHPDRPSAVRRGHWILENLFCQPPPPPPPNAEGLDVPDPFLGSVRSQEEARRADDSCQGCHERMDPIGFALGHLDAAGGIRAIDELGWAVDGTAVLHDGTSVRSIVDLTPWIAEQPEIPHCVVEQATVYALGRPVTLDDRVALEEIEAAFLAGDAGFEALAQAIVASPAFRSRTPSVDLEDAP